AIAIFWNQNYCLSKKYKNTFNLKRKKVPVLTLMTEGIDVLGIKRPRTCPQYSQFGKLDDSYKKKLLAQAEKRDSKDIHIVTRTFKPYSYKTVDLFHKSFFTQLQVINSSN